MTVNETPTTRWLALDRKVSTHTAARNATEIAIVTVDPGRPNHRKPDGRASTMDGCNSTAAR